MAARLRAAKHDDGKLYTRTEMRALTGVPDPGAFREYELLGLVKPRRIQPSGIWIYSRADVLAIRAYRRERGLMVPTVHGFD
jgi:DNA-binding transcriptional MerR regulator